jgi:hypothetical protein
MITKYPLLPCLQCAIVLAALAAPPASGNQRPRMADLIAAVRPALPFPSASADGELPADNSAQSKWFVVWPAEPDDLRISVKANPLHPETQKAGAEAMDRINAAVAAAERRAQAAYDKALEDLRRTGKGSDIETITLDDEGVAGERIDAELEVVIESLPAASFDMASGLAPVVSAATRGPTWIVSVAANTYRATRGADLREHFRPAETRLYFGVVNKPQVTRVGDEPRFKVIVPTSADGFCVVLRGNESLVRQLTTAAEWWRLAAP